MLIVEYDPNNKLVAIADGETAQFVDNALRFHRKYQTKYGIDNMYEITTSNQLVINEFRLAVLRGYIPFDQLTFKFAGELIPVSINAKLYDWPEGFCDLNAKQLASLVTLDRKLRI